MQSPENELNFVVFPFFLELSSIRSNNQMNRVLSDKLIRYMQQMQQRATHRYAKYRILYMERILFAQNESIPQKTKKKMLKINTQHHLHAFTI